MKCKQTKNKHNRDSAGKIRHAEGFLCKQCGNCCKIYYDVKEISFTYRDFERFDKSGRQDIIDYIVAIPVGRERYLYEGWFSPTTGDEVERCPWLRKLPHKDAYKCRIYELRPDVCRKYPRPEEKEKVIGDGCRGWDHLDD
ncbi:YkgJ family cysteine cluster protein [bacterium]|nr:YkgJ family cysteine cluster protein [bacterium]